MRIKYQKHFLKIKTQNEESQSKMLHGRGVRARKGDIDDDDGDEEVAVLYSNCCTLFPSQN